MLEPFKAVGGARVGWVNASWPFARLSAESHQLRISVAILGTYEFAPDQVLSIEKYSLLPVLASGIRIRHQKSDCPKNVVFWCLGNPERILEGIRHSGFLPAAQESLAPAPRGFAIRLLAIIGFIAIWNGLFMFPNHGSTDRSNPQPFVLGPLLFAFAFSVGTLRIRWLQNIVLRPGHSVGEIRPFLRLLAAVSGLLLLIFSFLIATAAFNNPTKTRRIPDAAGSSTIKPL